MLISDSFIMLNLPKTGTTFTIKVIKEAFGESNPSIITRLQWKLGLKQKKLNELKLPIIRDYRKNKMDKHGIYDQIPSHYLNSNREIVSIIRDPFTARISRYNYASWKRKSSRLWNSDLVHKAFPHFPNLSFKEYLQLTEIIDELRSQDLDYTLNVELGGLSYQWIQMFCKDHKTMLKKVHKNFTSDSSLSKHFPKITFLRQENLNEDLIDFLSRHGFSMNQLDFIRTSSKQNVSVYDSYKKYLTPEAVDFILEKEWFLFKMFPEYIPENNPLFKD